MVYINSVDGKNDQISAGESNIEVRAYVLLV